jgi:hypothetical protein
MLWIRNKVLIKFTFENLNWSNHNAIQACVYYKDLSYWGDYEGWSYTCTNSDDIGLLWLQNIYRLIEDHDYLIRVYRRDCISRILFLCIFIPSILLIGFTIGYKILSALLKL